MRVVEKDGNPWWVAKDVAEILDIRWDGARTISHVPEEWRGSTLTTTPSGSQEMVTLAEQGLYFFICRSDKPKALEFQKWIAGEVIPSIRKTGSYGMPKIVTPPDPYYITSVNRSVSLKILSPDQGRAMLFAACNGSAKGIDKIDTLVRSKKYAPTIPPDATIDTLLSAFPGWSEKLCEERCTLERFGMRRIIARDGSVQLAIHHNHKEITKICGRDYKERMRLDPAYIETRQVHICREQVSALMFDWQKVKAR